MIDIPDEVIEQAREAGTDGYARPDGPSRVREVAAEAAFAQVIAEWATERERHRWHRRIAREILHREDHGKGAMPLRELLAEEDDNGE